MTKARQGKSNNIAGQKQNKAEKNEGKGSAGTARARQTRAKTAQPFEVSESLESI